MEKIEIKKTGIFFEKQQIAILLEPVAVGNDYSVIAVLPEGKKKICTIEQRDRCWQVSHARWDCSGEEIPNEIRYIKFKDPETTALFFVGHEIGVRLEKENHPLPLPIKNYLERHARELNESLKKAMSQCQFIQMQQAQLHQIGKKYNLEDIVRSTAISDPTTQAQDLINFSIDGEGGEPLTTFLKKEFGEKVAEDYNQRLYAVILLVDPNLANDHVMTHNQTIDQTLRNLEQFRVTPQTTLINYLYGTYGKDTGRAYRRFVEAVGRLIVPGYTFFY